MKKLNWFVIALLPLLIGMAGCEQNKSPVEKAVEGTKDALDARPHEKMKDAGENASDAVKDAAEGIRDETR